MALSGGGKNDVTIGVAVTGAADATRDLTELQKTVNSLNASSNTPGLSGATTSTFLGTGSGITPATISNAPPPTGLLGTGGAAIPAPLVNIAPTAPGVAQTPGSQHGGMQGGGGGQGAATSMNVGTTVINAGTVVVQGASVQNMPSAGLSAGSSAQGALPFGYGAPAPGGSAMPKWDPFGADDRGNKSFAETVYSSLDAHPAVNVPGVGPANLRGMVGSQFLSQNALGRQVFGGLQGLEPFLPTGALSGAAGVLGAAALPLGIIGAGAGIVAGAMQINNAATLPAYYQATRELGEERAGSFYDPLVRDVDRQIAKSKGDQGQYEAWRSNPIGWLLRVASFGIADASWDGYIKPGFERDQHIFEKKKTSILSARSLYRSTGIDLTYKAGKDYASNGDDMPDALRMLSQRASLAQNMGPISAFQSKSVLEFDFGKYSTADAGIDVMGRISQYALSPGLEGTAGIGVTSGGKSPIAYFDGYRKAAIARGDMGALSALREQYQTMPGGVSMGLTLLKRDLLAAQAVQTARTGEQVAQAGIGSAQAGISVLQSTGASYKTVAGAQAGIPSLYAPVLAGLQTEYTAALSTGNVLTISAAKERLDNASAAVAQSKRAAPLTLFAGRELEAGTVGESARNAVQTGMYFGTEGDVLKGYSATSGALRQEEQILRDKAARSDLFSPEERARMLTEANGKSLQARVGVAREKGGFVMGLRQGEIGIAGATAGSVSAAASLFGGNQDVYAASLGQADVTRKQLALTGREIAGDFGPRSGAEKDALIARQIELQRTLNMSLEEAKRSFSSATLGVAQFGQSMAASRSGFQMQYFGVGGADAGRLQGVNVAAARGSLAVAQSNINAVSGLPADNPYRMQRERELQQAKEGAQGAVQEMARLPFGVDLDRAQAKGQFALGAISRTYAAFGDVRGTVKGLMGNVADRGKELRENERQGLAEIDRDGTLSASEKDKRKKTFLRDIEQRKYSLGNEAIGYQQELEQGWQDRLISSVVGMPERGAFVASHFTRREAAPFLQTMSSVFGFSGKDGASMRDYYRDRGGRIANSVTGVIQRPDGFMATAMGGAVAPSGAGSGGVASGEVTIKVVVDDAKGNRLGRGQTAGTLHDLFNLRNISSTIYADGIGGQ